MTTLNMAARMQHFRASHYWRLKSVDGSSKAKTLKTPANHLAAQALLRKGSFVPRRFSWTVSTTAANGQRFSLCLTPKSASTRWRALMEAQRGAKEDIINAVHESAANLSVYPRQAPADWLDPRRLRVMLVRNPYVRFLSFFLDKVRNPDMMVYNGRVVDRAFVLPNFNLDEATARRISFTDFVRLFARMVVPGSFRVRSGPNTNGECNPHYCPQFNLCDLHIAENRGPDYVLPVESIDAWYPCLVDKLSIGELVRSGWPRKLYHTTKQSWADIEADMTCFYQPRNRDCNLQLLPGASPLNLSAPLEPAITVSHATGALSKLFEHYTVESAMIISRYYADDLAALGYPVWDGLPETFVLFPKHGDLPATASRPHITLPLEPTAS